MKTFYQMSGEDTMKQLNGSAEPLTESQVKEHQEKYGRNELVEGKKKTVLQIFLEQYKDFLVAENVKNIPKIGGNPVRFRQN